MLVEQRFVVAMLIALGVGAVVSTLSRRSGQRVPADHRTAESRRVPGAGVRLRDALVYVDVLRSVDARFANGHRRVPSTCSRQTAVAAGLRRTGTAIGTDARARGASS